MSVKKILIVVTCFCLLNTVFCQEEDSAGETEEQRLEREEQTVLRLREHILAGNGFEIVRALNEVTNLTTLARGFRFEPEERDIFLRETPERTDDPDVNAIRGFANAILGGADPEKLAEAFTLVLSLQGNRYLTNPAGTFQGLFESFTNRTEMEVILTADPRDNRRLSMRRKLLVKGTPADTMLCSKCFEKKFCSKNAPWC